MMKHLSYEQAEFRIQPGDVIAFGGSSQFSGIIKRAIRAEVSHIGIVLRTYVQDENTGELVNQIIDSTARNGVTVWNLRDRVAEYDGDVWWLPLRRDWRETRFNQAAFEAFLQSQVGKKYDQTQAVGSAIDLFDNIQLPFGWRGPGYNKEDFDLFFCSELVAAGLKYSGFVPECVNASEVTPIDLCRWNIYEPEYYLLKGDPSKEISGYNSLYPSNWNV